MQLKTYVYNIYIIKRKALYCHAKKALAHKPSTSINNFKLIFLKLVIVLAIYTFFE